METTSSKLLWSERHGDEIYVFFCGKLIYKRWLKKKSTEKRQQSVIFNDNGWPNEEIV